MDEILEQFIANLKVGLPGVESQGEGYNAQNPDSTAAGKYQFTKRWLPDIKKFSNGLYGEINTMEDFKNNPQLQDDYFEHYAKNVLFPAAVEISKNNPENFTIDEIGAIIHFQGEGKAKRQIKSGQLSPATKKNVNGAKYDNLSGYDYLKKYNQTRENVGLKSISPSAFLSDSEKEIITNDFQSQQDKINAMDINQASKEKLRSKLYQDVVNAGNVDIVNDYMKAQNEQNKENYNQKVSDYKELIDLAEKIDINYTADGKGRKFKDKGFFINWRKSDTEQREKLREKFDFFTVKNGKDKSKSDYLDFIDQSKLFRTIESLHKDVTGNEISITANSLNEEGEVGKIKKKGLKNFLDIGQGNNRVGGLDLSELKGEVPAYKDQVLIDETKYKKKSRSDVNEEAKKIAEEKSQPKSNESQSFAAKTEKPSDSDISHDDLGEQYFQTQLGLGALNDDNFNYTPGKRELPIDAIVGLTLGVIGNKQVKDAKIPLRTEEVSEAYKNFMAELKNRSDEGLPVEIEAAMKNQLADAYQGGLANIVNASGGNSATVLGNLGTLEQAKNKGLVAIQVADFEAKDRAFQQYGRALRYVNEFDSRRDIANHAIKYREAKEKQQIGRDVATAGFAKLIDAINYDRQNGPGSANDMYRSMLMQRMFGFDPKMKDDGSGTIVGTQSYYNKQKGIAQADFKKTQELYDRFGTLNPDQKKAFDGLVGQTQDKEQLSSFVDYLKSNPDLDLSKINMGNLDLATERNDFGLLSKDREKILSEPNTIMLSDEELNNQSPLLEEPFAKLKTPSLATPGFNPAASGGLLNF